MPTWLRSRIARLARPLAGPTLLFVITVGFCWKLVLTDQYTWLESPDLAYQVLPWFQFQAAEWHQGHFPLWDPYHWAGQPLLGQMITSAACPLNWILFLAPLNHGWIRQSSMHWYFVIVHFVAALAMYALCRDLLRSRVASIIAACVFAFGGFVGSTDWPCMLTGGIWTPFIFLFLFRAARGVRPLPSAILSGMFLGLAWLSGHHQVPLFITLTAVGVWLYFVLRSGRIDWPMLRLAAAAGIVLFLVSALQTFPGFEYGRLAKRWAGGPEPTSWDVKVPYYVHVDNSLSPDAILGIMLPGLNHRGNGYVGALAVALAILAIAAVRTHPIVQLCAAISLAGLILALGSFTLVHGVLYSVVPMVEKARSPCMAIVIFNFGIAVLSAYGMDVYLSSDARVPIRRCGVALVAFGFVLFLIGAALILANKTLYNDRAMTTALLATIGGTLILWAPHRRGLAAVFGILVLCELSQSFLFAAPNRHEKDRNPYLAKMAQGADLVAYLRTRPEPVRVDVDDKVFAHNFGDWWGVEQMSGYLAGLTTNMTYMETHTQRSQQLFSVNYFIGTEPKFPGQEFIMQSTSGMKLFRSPGAFPRTWVVHQIEQLQVRPQTTTFISNEKKDLLHTASLLGDVPDLQACAADEAVVTKHRPARVQIEARLNCRGMVILSDTWFPGWQATVDGEPARIYEAYGVLRGVVVDRGAHVIDMVYRPASVIWGGLLTAIGFVLSIAAQFIPARYLPAP